MGHNQQCHLRLKGLIHYQSSKMGFSRNTRLASGLGIAAVMIICITMWCKIMTIEKTVEAFCKIPTIKKSTKNQMRMNSSTTEGSSFTFLPKVLRYCEELLPEQKETKSLYHAMRPAFDRVFRTEAKDAFIEGNSGMFYAQTYAYLQLGSAPFIKTICEIGFNAGHSTLAWLTSNPHTYIYSFDLGQHQYSKPMAAFLKESFPGRLTNIWGDSTVTIPDFTKTHPNVVCDLIIVDGGHSFEVALTDLMNFRPLANKAFHLLVLDDCPHVNIPGPLRAWRRMLEAGYVEQRWTCQLKTDNQGGLTIGKYVTSNTQ